MTAGRTGISIFDVKDAKERLIARGKNPSIDAIRAELGNTGSKTTISRYLKELEGQGGSLLDKPQALTDTITAQVGRLVEVIHGEAAQVVDQARSEYNESLEALVEERENFRREASQNQQDKLLEMKKTTELREAKTELEGMLSKTAEELRHSQAEGESLLAQLGDAKTHIASLEDKHEKVRESLEHYREETQRQREVEADRHEAEKQQLQAEIRTYKQTAALKQDEAAQLATKTAGLAAELSEARRALHEETMRVRDLRAELASAQEDKSRTQYKNESLSETIGRLENELVDAKAAAAEASQLRVDLFRAQADLSAAERLEKAMQIIIDDLRAEKEKTESAGDNQDDE